MNAHNGEQKAKIRRIMLALDAMNCEAALMLASKRVATMTWSTLSLKK